jgi:hypothetical protein
MRMRAWVVWAGIAAGAAGCSSSTAKPGGAGDMGPPLLTDASFSVDGSSSGSDGAGGDTGAVPESGVDSSQGDAGPADGGVDGGGSDAGGGSDGAVGGNDGGGGEAGPPRPSACDPSLMWSVVARVPSIAPAGFDQFGSVSSTALTVAWTSSNGAIFVADRTDASSPFGTPAPLSPGSVALATGRVALITSGRKLIATLANGSSFITFVRPSVGAAWSPSNANEFAWVAAMIAESGGAMSDPVVSADGQSLFYLLTIGTAPGTLPILYESTFDTTTKQWNSGTPLPNQEFAITSASQRRRPTGASIDDRTLFFYDEVSGTERAAWRPSPTAPFDTFVDVAVAPEAAPNANCDTLYFHGTDTAGQGLFTAARP